MVGQSAAASSARCLPKLYWRGNGRPGQYGFVTATPAFSNDKVEALLAPIAGNRVNLIEIQYLIVISLHPSAVGAGDNDTGNFRRILKVHVAPRTCGTALCALARLANI